MRNGRLHTNALQTLGVVQRDPAMPQHVAIAGVAATEVELIKSGAVFHE
jgi:hypothetical protein